jgi:uncharacterized repeat protein (TIGR03803 family)
MCGKKKPVTAPMFTVSVVNIGAVMYRPDSLPHSTRCWPSALETIGPDSKQHHYRTSATFVARPRKRYHPRQHSRRPENFVTGEKLMKRLWLAVVALTLLPVPADAAREQVLWSFRNYGSDGEYPYGALISVNGTLYGMTNRGGQYTCGTYGCGTVFSLNPVSSKEKVLWSFGYGTDGENPIASLISVKGTLYGTTVYGGQYSKGTVFSLDPTTDTETVLWSFGNGTDGHGPGGSVISIKGMLYGTTDAGGQYGYGTVFSLDPKTDTEKVLWSFGNETDGANPIAGLISVNGTLYGTTYYGGQSNAGTVFSLDLATGAETVLWSFDNGFDRGIDGHYPIAGLIAANGVLYGTTWRGGKSNAGIVFSLDPETHTEKVLWSFGNGADGAFPSGSLISIKGTLYGTTVDGGQYPGGTVFSLDLKTDKEKVLWSFGKKTDGQNPEAGLIFVNETLYGTTLTGGAHHQGTVFSLTP